MIHPDPGFIMLNNRFRPIMANVNGWMIYPVDDVNEFYCSSSSSCHAAANGLGAGKNKLEFCGRISHTHTSRIDRSRTDKKKSALIRPDSESVNEVIDQDPCARPEATGQLIDH